MFSKDNLIQKASQIRLETFEMVMNAKCGHMGGSFSSLEVLVYLYYSGLLNHQPKNSNWPERDRFILSKGHANNSLYVVLADLGYFPKEELNRFCQNGTFLGNHSDKIVPGVEVSTGSLGHGLGLAAGISLGAKLSGDKFNTFVMLGDGESQEGSIWEAAMFAAQHKLKNLIAILDRNRLGSEDFTENTSGLDSVEEKWIAFGWETCSVNGHSFDEIHSGFEQLMNSDQSKPKILIANTIKGKGLPNHENQPRAHHTLPKGDEIEAARRSLT